MNTAEEIKDLKFYRENAEENYLTTPISVLRYISELEERVPQWISVEERLPDERTHVLIAISDPLFTGSFDIMTAKLSDGKWCELWNDKVCFDVSDEIYAPKFWMPLPEKPKM